VPALAGGVVMERCSIEPSLVVSPLGRYSNLNLCGLESILNKKKEVSLKNNKNKKTASK
jgi:hypothetical protein